MSIEIFTKNSGNTSKIGERIRFVRTSERMTQKTFSASLGIAQGFLCAIERGKKTPSETLMIAIQYLYKINRYWLDTGKGECYKSRTSIEETKKSAHKTPLLKTPPSSIDNLVSNEIDHYISLPEVPDNCFAFEYSGDFMSPTIRDRDLVIINPEKSPSPGEIVLITGKWGDSFLRRYRSMGGEIFLSSDNSSYSTFKAEKGTKIIGVVDSVWRKIKY